LPEKEIRRALQATEQTKKELAQGSLR